MASSIVLFALLLQLLRLPDLVSALELSSPSLYIFGASMVDAGENSVAMPRSSDADFYPYSVDYFDKPTGRWSNGRNFMDLITQGLGIGLISPYLKSFGSDFSYGVNFASSGSTAQNTTATGDTSSGLFCLSHQIEQFRDYQNYVFSRLVHQGADGKHSPEEHFSSSIYFFETAHNDYIQVAFKTSDFDPLATVLATISAMKQAFKLLYDLGARTFLVMSLTPLGCNPSTLSNPYATENRDKYGCKTDYLGLVKMHNEHLLGLLSELRTEHPIAEWVYFDAYSIMLDGYHNPSKYGIKYPFQACCGAGGPYNFKQEAHCGRPGKIINGTYFEAKRCETPQLHLIWDSLHPVESFCHYIALGVLSGTHLSPTFNIKERF